MALYGPFFILATGMKLTKEDRQLWRSIVQTIRPFPITSPQSKLLVGVSGGTDSLALLHLLWRQLGSERLVVAHLNHGLRPEALADAQFVMDTAVAWQIPIVTKEADVAGMAKAEGLSVEAAGRRARYRFFAEQAAKVGATAVAVAHHADDQAETVLLHLLRGSGTAGLRGMLPVTVVPEDERVGLIRPFLNSSREQLEAYCARHGLTPVEDSSNADVQFSRNRIRHELLPLLQTYNPQIAARLQQLATITAADYAAQQAAFQQAWPQLLVGQGDDWLILHRLLFAAQPVAWQRLALRHAVQQLRPTITDVGFRTIEQARQLILDEQSGTEATLPGGLIMQVEPYEVVFGDGIHDGETPVPQLISEVPLQLTIPGQVDLGGGWRIVAKLRPDVELQDVRQNEDVWQAFVVVDADALWIRPSHSNERFQPLGMAGHSQRIQDLLADRKVSGGKRPLWPVVATANHAAWIVGQHLDERVCVGETAVGIVQLTCLRHK